MELIEGSETSAIRTQTPGNYPKENTLQVLHYFSLIKKTVARFVDTGCFLIRYSNGHMKYTHRQLKKFRFCL